MTIATDVFTSIGSGTTTVSATHTPSGTPRGVFVYLTYAGAGDFENDIREVLYGGVPLEYISGANCNGGEDVYVAIYFLGTGIPTGAQTVRVSRGGHESTTVYVDCLTVTAASDLNPIRNVSTRSVGSGAGTTGTDITPSSGTPSGNFYSAAAAATGNGGIPTIVTSGFTTGRSTDLGSFTHVVVYDSSERSTGDGECNFNIGGVADELVGCICTVEEGTDNSPPVKIIAQYACAIGDGVNGGPLTIDLTEITCLAEDDIVVACVVSDDSTTSPSIVTSGYTSAATVTGTNNDANMAVAWKAMGATVDTSVVSSTHGANDGVSMCAYVLRGADTSAPVSGTPTTAESTSAALPNAPSLTPSDDDTTFLIFGAIDNVQQHLCILNDGEYVNETVSTCNDTNDTSIMAAGYYQVGTAAAKDPPVWPYGTAAGNQWVAATLAFTSAGTPTPSGAVSQAWSSPWTQTVNVGLPIENAVTQTWSGGWAQTVNITANVILGNIAMAWDSPWVQTVNVNSTLSGGSGRTRSFTGSGI